MFTNQKLTVQESTAINISKALSILSVLSAHTVAVSNTDLLSKAVSSFWVLYGEVGVIAFFIIGGFLYNRTPNDGITFWKKKFSRIILPWLICSTITYAIHGIADHHLSAVEYLKWIFGSRTWYYYITLYILFLFLFKRFYNKDTILLLLMGIQTIVLILISFGVSTTIPWDFFTVYLNPLHWVGYFSLGILIRRHRWDRSIREHKRLRMLAYFLAAASGYFLYSSGIFSYFHIVSSLFCLSCYVIITDASYALSSRKAAKHIGDIGICSYCIYLLHMQIVQPIIYLIPDGLIKFLFAPIISLAIMLTLISIGIFVCSKLPFGEKVKALVGL